METFVYSGRTAPCAPTCRGRAHPTTRWTSVLLLLLLLLCPAWPRPLRGKACACCFGLRPCLLFCLGLAVLHSVFPLLQAASLTVHSCTIVAYRAFLHDCCMIVMRLLYQHVSTARELHIYIYIYIFLSLVVCPCSYCDHATAVLTEQQPVIN